MMSLDMYYRPVARHLTGYVLCMKKMDLFTEKVDLSLKKWTLFIKRRVLQNLQNPAPSPFLAAGLHYLVKLIN